MFKSCYIIPLKLKFEQILASNKAALANLEYLIFISDSYLNLVRVRTKLMMFITSLSTIFQLYIVVVSFIGGGNQCIQRKQPTCQKSLTNFIT
jgi:hypothetical protein